VSKRRITEPSHATVRVRRDEVAVERIPSGNESQEPDIAGEANSR
jgi:stress response protein YsnF